MRDMIDGVEIGEQYFRQLGRIVTKFASLDDAIAMAIYTMTNNDPVTVESEQITSISGSMEQPVWRLIISGTTFEQRVEMLYRVAVMRFADEDVFLKSLRNELKKVMETRNKLMHHSWVSSGQIGFSRYGVVEVTTRTEDELKEFVEAILNLRDKVTFLHEKLLGLDVDPKIYA